MDRKFR